MDKAMVMSDKFIRCTKIKRHVCTLYRDLALAAASVPVFNPYRHIDVPEHVPAVVNTHTQKVTHPTPSHPISQLSPPLS